MTNPTPITQMPKPGAEQYMAKRKLFLVPNIALPAGLPEEGDKLLERYWSEVRDSVERLERSLGAVRRVFHESLFEDSEENMARWLEMLNPKACAFIQVMCSSTARLEPTEDRALVEENADWQRCVSIGLMSEKVQKIAWEGYHETTRQRYEHIGKRIGEALQEGESGVIFIREDHRVQFPSDVQVFYVAPPSLDAIKRWVSDYYRAAAQSQAGQESDASNN